MSLCNSEPEGTKFPNPPKSANGITPMGGLCGPYGVNSIQINSIQFGLPILLRHTRLPSNPQWDARFDPFRAGIPVSPGTPRTRSTIADTARFPLRHSFRRAQRGY